MLKNNTLINLFRYLSVLSFLALLSSGCVRFDPSCCNYPLRLKFSYTLNAPGTELFQEEVTSMELFFYDSETGHIVKRTSLHAVLAEDGSGDVPAGPVLLDSGGEDQEEPSDNGILEPIPFEYSVDLPPGRYDVVAWGGARDTYGYSSTHMIDEAYIYAKRRADTDQKYVDPGMERLFYGTLHDLVIDGDLTGTHVLDLLQNTNSIRIVVTGLGEDHRSRFTSEMSALNGACSFLDNRSIEGISTIYDSENYLVNTSLVRDFRTLRLWKGDSSRLLLRVNAAPGSGVWDPDKVYTIFDGSLSDLLLMDPNTDLDAVSDYVIEFQIGDLGQGDVDVDLTEVSMKVIVNDWVVIDQDSNVG